jgi:hypothetical protein
MQYRQTGAIFSIAGRPGAVGRMEVDLSIELAAISESAAAVTEAVKRGAAGIPVAPLFFQ